MAHAAFFRMLFRLVEARRAVRAGADAVCAADAGFLVVHDHAVRPLFVRRRRAGIHTGGMLAMVARQRKKGPVVVRINGLVQRIHLPPDHVRLQLVEVFAGHGARAAANALIHIHQERASFTHAKPPFTATTSAN